MRLAYLADSTLFSGAANTIQVLKMAQALVEEGHWVTLHLRAGSLPVGWLDRLRHDYGVAAGFQLRHWRLPRCKGHSYLYGLVVALAARLSGAELAYCRSLPAFAVARLLGLPAVLELHQPLEDTQPGWFRHWLPLCWRDARRVRIVVITSALREHLERRHPELQGRIQVAADGADPLPASVQPCLPAAPSGRLRVGYSGQLYPGKGAELILALAPLCPWADFHLVGGRPEDVSRWRAAAADLPNLHWHGSVPHAQVSSYLRSFDVALLPLQARVATASGSGTDIASWTSPLKLFEYMAAGLPILSSDLPVLHDVLEHGRNALLCPPDQPQAWRDQLERLLRDPPLREQLGRTALADFESRYSWRARARKVLPCG